MKLSRLQQLAGIPLNESTLVESSQSNYLPMFQDILNNPDILQHFPSSEQEINNIIKNVRNSFNRSDIVMWVMRYERLEVIRSLLENGKELSNETKSSLTSILQNSITDMAKKSGVPQYGERHISDFIGDVIDGNYNTLKHYLSLPIPEIQQFRFAHQSAKDVFGTFLDAELKWKRTVSQIVPQEDDHELVMSFGNGMAWWNLNKPVCKVEGGAMEHCGNAGEHNEDDTILSLRSKAKDKKGKPMWKPHLTFTVTADGMLVESKGRKNQKPSEKYHEYIVALLRSDIINGIQGGGWQPEHNFSLADLDEDVQTELILEKPMLATMQAKVDKFGWDSSIVLESVRMLDEKGMKNALKLDGGEEAIYKMIQQDSSISSLKFKYGTYGFDDPVVQQGIKDITEKHNLLPMLEHNKTWVILQKWETIDEFVRTQKERDQAAESILDAIEDVKTRQPLHAEKWLGALRERLRGYVTNGYKNAMPYLMYDTPNRANEFSPVMLRSPIGVYINGLDYFDGGGKTKDWDELVDSTNDREHWETKRQPKDRTDRIVNMYMKVRHLKNYDISDYDIYDEGWGDHDTYESVKLNKPALTESISRLQQLAGIK